MEVIQKNRIGKFATVFVYSLAMAYLESAVVVYLRQICGITNLTTSLVSFEPRIAAIEMGREFATLAMLFAVGWIAGKNPQSRIGYFLFSFGIWDIFYYLWLKVLLGWPATLLDTDLLFLLPLPWWGPVLAPAMIALAMAIFGFRLVRLDDKDVRVKIDWLAWATGISGVLILLYSFMADALPLFSGGVAALQSMKPTAFHWTIFCLGLALLMMSFEWISHVEK